MSCEVGRRRIARAPPNQRKPLLCLSRVSPLPWACFLHPQVCSECVFFISVRPRKTVRGKQGVIAPAARPGRRPGKKPHPTRRSRPKAPPVDEAEVDELVRIMYHLPSSISVRIPHSSMRNSAGSRWEPPLCSLLPNFGD